ncbi:DMT family transporter [Oxalobacter formigenes]
MKRITFYLVGFAFLMFFDTLGQCSFKMTAIHALPLTFDLPWLGRVFWQPYVYMAIGGYIGAFFTWMTLLKRAPVGPAFAASHLEVVTVMIASVWVFNEEITIPGLIGAALIVGGIICLAFAEKELADKEKVEETGKALE